MQPLTFQATGRHCIALYTHEGVIHVEQCLHHNQIVEQIIWCRNWREEKANTNRDNIFYIGIISWIIETLNSIVFKIKVFSI